MTIALGERERKEGRGGHRTQNWLLCTKLAKFDTAETARDPELGPRLARVRRKQKAVTKDAAQMFRILHLSSTEPSTNYQCQRASFTECGTVPHRATGSLQATSKRTTSQIHSRQVTLGSQSWTVQVGMKSF